MSFKARLKVAGKDLPVLNAEYEMKRNTDATGRPSEDVRGGKIRLTVESTGETPFFEWMCNSFERKDGSIVFSKRDSDATMKELTFTEAYMTEYAESFDSDSSKPVRETFTISAKTIKLGNGEHKNEWPE
jgi:hypothetical protein